MGPTELLRLLRLLGAAARPADAGSPVPRGVQEAERPARAPELPSTLYSPASGATPRALLVALHGVTINGGGDPRLRGLARALARSGCVCCAPTLPALSHCRFEPEELQSLVTTVARLAAEYPGLPLGLVGFSYGASYALCAAGHSDLAARTDFVVAFGAYFDLAELLDGYVARRHAPPADAADEDNWLYLQAVLAQGWQERSGLEPAARARLAALLGRWCQDAALSEKRRVVEQVLGGRDMVARVRPDVGPQCAAALSPARHLERLQAAVSLVHDTGDTLVPPEHSRRLAEALRVRGQDRVGLLVTDLLAHVQLRAALRPAELLRLAEALRPLVQTRRARG